MSMEDYPSDWEYRRRNVLRRDKYECQACGISDENAKREYDCGLHAHHIHAIADGGGHELDNLISLCQECHVRVHAEEMESPYEPIYVHSCNCCDDNFIAGNGFRDQFCCSSCWARNRVEGVLNQVDTDSTICSTCFARVHYGEDTCPECGNWELGEARRDNLNAEELDIEYLLMYALYRKEVLDDHKD